MDLKDGRRKVRETKWRLYPKRGEPLEGKAGGVEGRRGGLLKTITPMAKMVTTRVSGAVASGRMVLLKRTARKDYEGEKLESVGSKVHMDWGKKGKNREKKGE